MNLICIEEIRKRWEEEKPLYRSLGESFCNQISEILNQNGISVKLSYRIKETDSLVKKIARKNSNYDSIHDKVGIRIVTYFKEQLETIDNLLITHFKSQIDKREDMSEKLGENVFGYQSIHYDLLHTEDNQKLYCELQLRTICQNNWSELSHALAYKSEINIPSHIKREINALSAVFELADNQFQLIQSMIDRLPDSNPIRVLNHIEKYFYTYFGSTYDKELTSYFLKNISSLYGEGNPILLTTKFFSNFNEIIISKVKEYRDNIFVSQPEILILFERLHNNKYSLISYWKDLFPIDELEEIANIWGTSIE